jgi:beta-mannosidase
MINEKLLDGQFSYITDENSSLSFDEALIIYKKKKNHRQMNIPVNWEVAGLNNFNGTVWFFREFSQKIKPLSLTILEFGGVDYFTDVWLNDSYIGSHKGYFQKFYFDISGYLKSSNQLVLKVTSPKEEPGTVWPYKKKLIKGIFNHHDCRPGGWSLDYGQDKNTGGIWNSVFLKEFSAVYISGLKITTRLNNDYSNASVTAELQCLANKPANDELKIIVIPPSGKQIRIKQRVEFSPGVSSMKIEFSIEHPELWWTWDLGSPNLYKLKISGRQVNINETFGIREVRMDDRKVFYLNNKKLFLRGTNIIPEQFLCLLSPEKISEQVSLVRDTNINIIRMHAHVNRKEYYDECDRKGILVWQDFALQWTYDDSEDFALNAVAQIKNMVCIHYNHPSIAFWCCHNEPGEQINTLDPKLFEAVKSEDNTRIIRIASNYEEHPYDGWYWGNMEHFAACPMGPVVTEFGAQAVPEMSSLRKFMSKKEIEKPDYEKWKYHNFQYEQTFHIAEVDKGKNTKELIFNSQKYQSRLLQTAVDFYRRERFSKVNALFQFMFIDCWPSITWSVIDYYGRKKEGYFTLKKVFQPLYISIKLMRRIYFPGSKLNINIWLINDFHKEFQDCIIEFYLNLTLLSSIHVEKVQANSLQFFEWEKNEIKLPERISPGNYEVVSLLKDSSGKVLSVNTVDIVIDKNK